MKRDCEKIGTTMSIIGVAGYTDAGRIILSGSRPFLTSGFLPYDTVILSGNVLAATETIDKLRYLVIESDPVFFRDNVIHYKATAFRTNVLMDVSRQVGVRDEYTQVMDYAWQIVASGVYGYRTDVGGEQIFLGSGMGPIPLDAEEMLIPAASGAQVDDRIQVVSWVDGPGPVIASGSIVASADPVFDGLNIRVGSRIVITDDTGQVAFAHIESVDTVSQVTVVETGLDITGTWTYLVPGNEVYRVNVIKDNKFEGVLSCSVIEDTR